MEPVTEVIPGLYQIKVPIPNNPLGFTLSYLLTGPDGHILIDTGIPQETARDELLHHLRDLIDLSDLRTLAITHSHPDHSGLIGEVKNVALNARVVMHEQDWSDMRFSGGSHAHGPRDGEQARERLTEWMRSHGFPHDALEEALGEMGRWMGGERSEILPAGEPDIQLQGGEEISSGRFTLRTIHTPGHSPGHLCYYEPDQRIMFTGDHVLPIVTSNVSVRPGSGRSPLEDYLQSLEKVGEYDVRLVCPAHEFIFEDLGKRIRELLHHHDARLNAVLRAMEDEPRTGYEIAERVPWDVGAWEGMSHWLRRSALGETLSHVEVLIARGRARRLRENGVIRFEMVNS